MIEKSQAISAGHEVTLAVAREILLDGGNAFDAAIGAYAAACVAEPCMASLGAGAIAHIYRKGESPRILDFFCQTPKSNITSVEKDFWPISIDFGDTQEVFYGGMAAIAVPGAIAGLFELHRSYASRPIKILLEPAIELAKTGVAVNDFQHYDLVLLRSVFEQQERVRSLFLPGGNLINVGDMLSLPHMADFMDYLSHEGPNAFYQGEVARKLINDCKENGGFLSMDDLKSYQAIYRSPILSKLAGHKIYSNPLPATGGALMTLGLDVLQEHKSNKIKELLNSFQKMESMEKDPGRLGTFLEGRNRRGATTHFNIVDRWGNAISLTMTIGEGSGYFIPGTDIHMNNMLGEKSLVPKGWHQWKPDIRLSTMMNPTLVFDQDNQLALVAGSGGASRIPGAIMQVIRYLFIEGKNIFEAVQAPRLHLEYGQLDIEPDLDLDASEYAAFTPKIWNQQSMFFGGVHSIARLNGSLEAVGDQRRDGVSWVA